jgi:hypothetical protein
MAKETIPGYPMKPKRSTAPGEMSPVQLDALKRNGSWEVEPAQQPARRQNTSLVLPTAKTEIVRIEPYITVEPHQLAPSNVVQTVQKVETSEVDRAKGFNLAVAPLAGIAGLVAAVIAAGMFSVPVWSGLFLVVLFGTFAATWTVAYFWNQITSVGGLGLMTIIFHYRILRYEQKDRLRRMRGGE